MANFRGCKQCSKNNITSRPVIEDHEEDSDCDEDDEDCEVVENIKYEHVCGVCDHLIAKHKVQQSIMCCA